MKTKTPKYFLITIVAIIIFLMIYAVISDWANFKAGLAGQAPIH